MKRYFIGLMLIVSACSTNIDKKREQVLPLIKNQYVSQLNDFFSTSKELLAAIENGNDSIKIRQAFEKSRYAYKELEIIAEFYNPDFSKRINGAPVDKVDNSDPERILSATGLQVIEEYVYPHFDTGSRSELIAETKKVVNFAEIFARESDALTLSESNVFEALKIEIVRIVSMGISGFDSPVALNSINECKHALIGIGEILKVYYPFVNEELADLNLKTLKDGQAYLSDHNNFNDFNRGEFIVDHLSPLYSQLFSFQEALDIENNTFNAPIDFTANQLFGKSFYNLGYFAPSTNKYPNTQAQELGEMLFYDPLLSKDNDRSCASCHLPQKGFTDGLTKSIGLNGSPVRRNSPTIINSGFQQTLFADSRVAALENLVFDVINNQNELHGSIADVSAILNEDSTYQQKFKKVFNIDSVEVKHVQMALGTYSRSIIGMDSRFDQYLRGDKSQLTEEEVHGFTLYMGKAKCGTCHFAPLFNGTIPPLYDENESEVIGVPAKADTINAMIDQDSGRYYIVGGDLNLFSFKIPTLRNAELTAPYMHNGVYQTLEEVMDFYNRGGGAGIGIDLPHQTLPTDPLNLTEDEIEAVVAFIKTLTDNPDYQSKQITAKN